MEPGVITVISEPRNFDPTDAIAQIDSDQPPAWYKFRSTTDLTNSGTDGATWDGTYEDPPVTLVTGPFTTDEATTKGLKLKKKGTGSDPTLIAGTFSGAADFRQYSPSAYDSDTLYTTGDLVSYNSGSGTQWFKALQNSQGQALTNTAYWEEYLPSSESVPLSLPTREPWSIEFWLRVIDGAPTSSGISTAAPFVSGRAQMPSSYWGSWYAGYSWGLGRNGVEFDYSGWGNFLVPTQKTGFATIDWDEWHHIVVTNSGSSSKSVWGRKAMYCDGELTNEHINGVPNTTLRGAYQSMPTSAVTHQPGATEVRISNGLYQRDLGIAHLAFYPRELSVDRVRQHYQAAP